MEFCQYTLQTYVAKLATTATDTRVLILIQCADAIEYLHRNKVVHRDLKPDNVLIHDTLSGPVIKVTDFTFAKDLTISGASGGTSCMTTILGNVHWMAPELLNPKGQPRPRHAGQYKSSVDIFSLGVIFVYVSVTDKGRAVIRNKIGNVMNPMLC
jgi:serine/threonine protein kinase